ncbi:MAG TPA: cytochrome c maturation protein CcmE [Planctomycetota bacterium]|nr:cytochrome c maturation protein CcmE [Planctomycetota bacterium]
MSNNDDKRAYCSGSENAVRIAVRTAVPLRRKLIVGCVVIIAGLAALLIAMSYLSLDFYSSVSEFLQRAETGKTGVVRVRGIVAAGSVNHDAKTLDTEFTLADGKASLQVFYHGVLPSSFESGSDLVVQGSYDPAAKRLVANQLMFKCPSKYEKKKGVY